MFVEPSNDRYCVLSAAGFHRHVSVISSLSINPIQRLLDIPKRHFDVPLRDRLLLPRGRGRVEHVDFVDGEVARL